MVRGPKEQSLLERSRKVLGESSKKIFSIGSRSDKDSSQPAQEDEESTFGRRRNQVRRAQRSHRERKENYMKALEDEVVRLRSSMSTRVRELETRADGLVQFIIDSGLQVPPHLQKSSSPAAQSTSVTLQPEAWIKVSMNPPILQQDSRKEITNFSSQSPTQPPVPISPGLNGTSSMNSISPVNWISPSDAATQGSGTTPAMATSPAFAHGNGQADQLFLSPSSDSPAFQTAQLEAPFPNHTTLASPQSLPDPNQHASPWLGDYTTAMTFVLTLEHMCTQMHLDPFGTGAGSGHVLMGSAHLLNQGPPNLVEDITWQVPNASIEDLLLLSAQLDLEGEITPVQAWQRLQQHPQFPSLNRNKLNDFTQYLCQHAKCYGFGAVLHTEVFEEALAKLFLQL